MIINNLMNILKEDHKEYLEVGDEVIHRHTWGKDAPRVARVTNIIRREDEGTDNNIKSADYFCARIDLQSSQQIHSATDSWKAYGANESAKAYTGQMDIWRIGTSDVYSMDWKMTSSQSTGSGAKIQILHGFVESSTIA